MTSVDPSFAMDGRLKGSYIRAVEDIDRALSYLQIDKMPGHGAFLYYYLSCEKLARIMKGVCCSKRKSEVFGKGSTTPRSSDIYSYSRKLKCQLTRSDIDEIFDRSNDNSARTLRDLFVHEIGPTHAKLIVALSKKLGPRMRKFLESRTAVIQCIKSTT